MFCFSGGDFRENKCFCSKQFSFIHLEVFVKNCRSGCRNCIERFQKNVFWRKSTCLQICFSILTFGVRAEFVWLLANIFRSFFKLAFLFAEEQLEDGFSFWRFHRFLIFLVVLPVIFRLFGENIIAACSVVHVLFFASIWNLWVVFLENSKHFVHNFGTWAVFFWTFGGKVSPVFLKLPSACPEDSREDFFKKL